LKDTTDYAEMEDAEIMKAAKTLNGQGAKGISDTFNANRRARGASAEMGKKKQRIDNDWIPTEAVRIIFQIKETFNS